MNWIVWVIIGWLTLGALIAAGFIVVAVAWAVNR